MADIPILMPTILKSFVIFYMSNSEAIRNLTKVWKQRWDLCLVAEHGLEITNLHSLKSYKIGITFTNFQKLNFKNKASGKFRP